MLSRRAIGRIVRHYGADILTHEHMEVERRAYQHGNVTTYEHSVRVARLAVWLADRLRLWRRVDLRSLVRAALLHDYFLYDWHVKDKTHRLHGFFHPGVALANAQKEYVLSEREKNIILRHMWPLTPCPPACREAWIVTAADKYCSLRETLFFRRRRNA